MKKNFALHEENKKPDRVVESVKAEVNKYLARERRKTLPQGVDYWDFDCRVGAEANSSQRVHVKELSKSIDHVAALKVPSVYIEILAKPGVRAKKSPREDEEFHDED
jgi:hypothetical protein